MLVESLIALAGPLLAGARRQIRSSAVDQTPVSRAIRTVAASFADRDADAAGHLTDWCESQYFNSQLNDMVAGRRVLTDDDLIETFLRGTGLYAEDPRALAFDLLAAFLDALVVELHKSELGLVIHARAEEMEHDLTRQVVESQTDRILTEGHSWVDRIVELLVARDHEAPRETGALLSHEPQDLFTLWPPPEIAEIAPKDLGVASSMLAERNKNSTSPSPYVPRAVDKQIDVALRTSSFVLITGERKAGKTRSAFEALMRVFPDAGLIVPRADLKGFRHALEPVERWGALTIDPRPLVVLLDDLEDHIYSSAPTEDDLKDLHKACPEMIVIATLSSPVPAKMTPDSAIGESVERLSRLPQVATVNVEAQLNESESPAVARLYPRVAADPRFMGRLGPYLAGMDEVVERFTSGWEQHSAGMSLVYAAIDWMLIGLHDPLTESLLLEIAKLELEERGGTGSAVDLRHALSWALAPMSSGISLLTRRGSPASYLPIDYLVDAERFTREVPESIWMYVARDAKSLDSFRVAHLALRAGRLDAAKAASERGAKSCTPFEASSALLLRGAIGLEDDEGEFAEAFLNDALEMGEPSAEMAAVLLADRLRGRSDFGKARRLLAVPTTSSDEFVRSNALLVLGLTLIGEGLEQEAEGPLSTVVDLQCEPASPQAAFHLAKLKIERGEVANAIKDLRLAMETSQDPKLAAQAGVTLGPLLGQQKLKSSEKAVLERTFALRQGEVSDAAGVLLGFVYLEEADPERADAVFRAAAASRNNGVASAAAYLVATRCLKLSNLEEARVFFHVARESPIDDIREKATGAARMLDLAVGELTNAQEYDPVSRETFQEIDLDVLAALIRMFAERDDILRAQTAFDTLVAREAEETPRIAKAAFFLGMMHERANAVDEAANAYELATRATDLDLRTSAQGSLGLIFMETSDYERAAEMFELAKASPNPTNATVGAVHLAIAFQYLERLPDAEAEFRSVLESGHVDFAPEAAYRLGEILWQRGDLRSSSIVLQRAASFADSEFGDIARETLGHVYADLGETTKAVELYEDAIERDVWWKDVAAMNLGALWCGEGEVEAARHAYLVAAESENPEIASHAQLALGNVLMVQHDYRGAEAMYRAAMESPLNDVVEEAGLLLGNLLIFKERLEEARAILIVVAAGSSEHSKTASEWLETVGKQ